MRWARWDRLGVGNRQAEVWTLACMYLAGAAGSLLGVLFPLSENAPVGLGKVLVVLCGAGAVVIWVFGGRWGRPLLLAGVVGGVAMISLIIAQAATTYGATVTAFAYCWCAVYAGHFLPRREAWAVAGAISAGFGAALLVNDLQVTVAAYVLVVGTIWLAVTVLGDVVGRMREQADTDNLTGLLNRTGFRAVAQREHALAGRSGAPLALVVVDLDGFKLVNDGQGHAAGDRMLARLAAAWRATLRQCDIVGRHGGDEFVLLLPATTAPDAGTVLHRLRSISPIGWSAGVADWRQGESLDECLARADQALYREKAMRRDVPRQTSGRSSDHVPVSPRPE